MEFKVERVLTNETVFKFVSDKADSLSCCPGYMLAGIISTSLFVIGSTSNLVTPSGHDTKPNIYQLICGPPSTGKSQAIKESGLDPLNTLSDQDQSPTPVIQKTTSSGLTKTLSTIHKGFIISTEIFDTLFKLLKGDCDAGTGETSLFCELFSGEQVSLNYASQAKRDIPEKMPFCILGSVQMYPLSKLMVLLDQGHGLLDRFLIFVPLCLRPTPLSSEEARERLRESPVSFLTDIFLKLNELVSSAKDFTFSPDASVAVKQMEEECISEINDAIRSGKTLPKSKKIDLVMRVALALHVFTSVSKPLLEGVDIDIIPLEISLDVLNAAIYYVTFCEMQKSTLSQFILELGASALDPPRFSPTVTDIKAAIALFPGKMVTFRVFRASGPRAMRTTSEAEFSRATEELLPFGKVVEVRVPRAAKKTAVFLKKAAAAVGEDNWSSAIDRDAYETQFTKKTHNKISPNIRQNILDLEDLPADYFD
ncbi:hypothetical protein HOLleu_43181 [Holothuria leucospilota]|uniref:Uncharacterized protein n=1 Tax=Holothuria leucospilota TaxID=206669 RepID=A0A9Q0YC68_HOLLE|nr:hypothetical protein HOLleu_43181 [Holothuria leucospilota]